MWSQTPQFDLSLDTSSDVGVDMNVRHGAVNALTFKDDRIPKELQKVIRSALLNRKLQDVGDWMSFLESELDSWDEPTVLFFQRLNEIMPIPKLQFS